VLKPLAPARYKIELTASAGLRDKLERLKALMIYQAENDYGKMVIGRYRRGYG
jgi:hypothetical protein